MSGEIKIGYRHNMFTVLKLLPSHSNESRPKYGLSLCDCGNVRKHRVYQIKAKRFVSCGCIKMELIKQKLTKPVDVRFWSKVKKQGDLQCWEWTARRNRAGYGTFKYKNRTVLAHRVVFELLGKSIPSGMYVDHMCRNRACLNPQHLRFVTPEINALENSKGQSAINKSKNFCKNGHPLIEENLMQSKTRLIKRQCKICHREYTRQLYADRKTARPLPDTKKERKT